MGDRINLALRRALAWILALPHGDKIAHALAGAVVGLAALLLTESDAIALAATVIAAVGKEWLYDRDRQSEHAVDPLDAAATVAGWLLLRAAIAITGAMPA